MSTDLATLEICVGLWQRAFASARVQPETPVTTALTPEILAVIGRSLISPGEIVLEIVVEDGQVVLLPVSSHNVMGGPSPASWSYMVDMAGPSLTESKNLPSASVVHVRYAIDKARPWQGIGPLESSDATCRLAANLESALRQEAGGATGYLIPTPPGDKGTLQADIRGLKGKVALVDSTSDNWEQGQGGRPKADWELRRLGPQFTDGESAIREGVNHSILAACGVPVAVLGRSDGTLARESYRQFVSVSVQPIAKQVTAELAEKLAEPDLKLDFTDLRSADIMGRARAYASMVGAGLTPDQAGDIAGLFEGA